MYGKFELKPFCISQYQSHICPYSLNPAPLPILPPQGLGFWNFSETIRGFSENSGLDLKRGCTGFNAKKKNKNKNKSSSFSKKTIIANNTTNIFICTTQIKLFPSTYLKIYCYILDKVSLKIFHFYGELVLLYLTMHAFHCECVDVSFWWIFTEAPLYHFLPSSHLLVQL